MPKLRSGPHRPTDLGLTHPDLWGVYVGDGCVTGQAPLEWLTVAAHAHVGSDEWAGWICIADNVLTPKGNPTHLLLHEIAHVIRGNTSHDAKWRRILTDLGAKREASRYEKPRRMRNQITSM